MKKRRKKLTTTGKHGTMYQVFFGVFTHFSKFSRHAWEKIPKMLVFTRVYVCVKAKLTLVFDISADPEVLLKGPFFC